MKMEQTECSETSEYKTQRRGITQKKAYSIHNTTKVWNQEKLLSSVVKFPLNDPKIAYANARQES